MGRRVARWRVACGAKEGGLQGGAWLATRRRAGCKVAHGLRREGGERRGVESLPAALHDKKLEGLVHEGEDERHRADVDDALYSSNVRDT